MPRCIAIECSDNVTFAVATNWQAQKQQNLGENILLPRMLSGMLFRILGVVLVCGFAVACSTPGRSYTDSNMLETLEVEILPNTSKMFVYRLRLPDEKMPTGVRIERAGVSRSDDMRGIAIGGSTQQRLVENTGYVVAQMGYCREGFLTIDSSVSQYNLWLKGECKEGASTADKEKFGTKQTLPVRLNP